MSTENPTPLRIGATGTLDGRRWRVAGRVVLSMQADDGETYHWNEFNLVDGFGRSATLVIEEGEDGPEWKFFKFFEPLRALTAAEAAKKRVGDSVALDGTPAKITLVDQSRVQHIEGVGPDGVEIGDVANYFNVDTGARMLVASWTGEEIEFYEGMDVPGDQVASAFGFPAGASTARTGGAAGFSGGVPGASSLVLKLVLGALAVVMLVGFFSCSLRGSRSRTSGAPTQSRSTPPPAKIPAPAPPARLSPGATGALAQQTYTIAGHAVIEIARVGSRRDRHEYALTGGTAESSFLVQGLTGGAKEWHLFTPVSVSDTPTAMGPFEAAVLRKGAPVSVANRAHRITELFQGKAQNVSGPRESGAWPALHYGFVARDADEWLLARWTERGIQFHRGRTLPETEVLAAFGPGPEKAR